MNYSENSVKDFIVKYYQYFIVGILFVIMVVVLAVSSGKAKTKSGDKDTSKKKDETSTVEVPDEPLKENAYPEVVELVNRYFAAMADGDSETLQQICTELDEREQIRIEKKADYIDSYDNLVCYTKPGPEEGSYIVFEYYDIRFNNLETSVPGLSSLFVKTGDDGQLCVFNSDKLSDDVKEYIKATYAQDDVLDLLHEIDSRYNEALASDEQLKNFMDALPSALDAKVSAEMAQRDSDSGEEGQAAASGPLQAKVKETINVRTSPSTDADKLGKKMGGDTVTVLEDVGDGWSKIDYQGEEGYVKTEYLEIEGAASAASEEGESASADAQETQQETQEEPQQTESTESSSASGQVKAKEAVSIRKEPSTDGQKLGSAYKGDTFEFLGEEGEWSKIKYDGQTAYIKSEFVEKN